MIRSVPMIEKSSLVVQFFGKDIIDRYASEDNMNFSLSFSSLWEICLMGFFFPFYSIFRLKIFALDEYPYAKLILLTLSDPIYIALINAFVSISSTFRFFSLD